MKKLDNSEESVNKNVPKVEQPAELSSNISDSGCSTLGYARKFTDKQIDGFIAYARILKRIHIRLLMEGYTIEDGKITPPPHKQHDANRRKYNNR